MYEGVIYPSSEHAYMAAKTTNPTIRNQIKNCPTSAAAKKLGRSIQLRPNWDNIKLGIMEEILRDKFTRNPNLRNQLIATGTEQLVEENWWGDVYWGVCNGKGQNNLGKLLMKIRKELSTITITRKQENKKT